MLLLKRHISQGQNLVVTTMQDLPVVNVIIEIVSVITELVTEARVDLEASRLLTFLQAMQEIWLYSHLVKTLKLFFLLKILLSSKLLSCFLVLKRK